MAIGDVGVTSHLQMSRTGSPAASPGSATSTPATRSSIIIGRPDPNHDLLQRARRALGLDYIAFDYAYDREGRVVVWEGNPYPWLHFSNKSLVYRNAAMHRTLAGLLKLYLDRAGVPATARLKDMLDYDRPPTTTWSGLAPMAVTRRRQAPARAMLCLGEVEIRRKPGDRIAIDLPCAPNAVKLVARSPGRQGSPRRSSVAWQGRKEGPPQDRRARPAGSGPGHGLRRRGGSEGGGRTRRWSAAGRQREQTSVAAGRFRKSRLHRAPALFVAAGRAGRPAPHPVDPLRPGPVLPARPFPLTAATGRACRARRCSASGALLHGRAGGDAASQSLCRRRRLRRGAGAVGKAGGPRRGAPPPSPASRRGRSPRRSTATPSGASPPPRPVRSDEAAAEIAASEDADQLAAIDRAQRGLDRGADRHGADARRRRGSAGSRRSPRRRQPGPGFACLAPRHRRGGRRLLPPGHADLVAKGPTTSPPPSACPRRSNGWSRTRSAAIASPARSGPNCSSAVGRCRRRWR